jgi:tetratricopeptide (TPR) repeat protein
VLWPIGDRAAVDVTMTAVTSPALIDAMRRINTLLQGGSFRDAHDQLAAIVEANPGYVEALRLLAGTKQALGETAAAEQLLRRALALDPNWTPTLVTLAELLLGSGRGGEAEALLQRALAVTPGYGRAALLLARYYNDSGHPNEALAVAAPLCVGRRVDAELAAQHISALAALGRQEEAVAGYRRIVAAAPGNLPATHALAIALSVAGRHEEAVRVAEHTLKHGHRTAALYNTYARSLIAQGVLDRAEAALRECLGLDPRLLDAHNSLAQLTWMRTGDVTQATGELDRALQRFGNDEALWAAKAAILQGAGDARGAYACLATLAERAHAPPTILVRAGLAALEFDPANAVNLAERALRVLPDSAAARTLLAAAQLGTGDARGALQNCTALLADDPDEQYLIALQTTAWRLLGDERYAQFCDYRNLVLPLQLEAPAPWKDLDSFLTDLRVSLNRLHNPHGHALLFQSLRHGTETTQDLSRSADPAIRALFGSFAAPIRRYLEHIGHGADALRRRNNGRWRFNGAWSVRLHSSGFHANHVHPRGWISSACYLGLPEGMSTASTPDGVLTFGEPGLLTSPRLTAEHSVRPAVGMLVLFPSYFWHGTVPFRGTQPRLTVAFDAVPEGQ